MNLFFSSNNKVVFTAGALGIVLDPISNTQRFFGGIANSSKTSPMITQHTSTINSIAISSDRKNVATAQIGKFPLICIWQPETCELKTKKSKLKLGDKKDNIQGISAMGFSEDGSMLAICDISESHYLYIIKVDTHEQVLKKATGTIQVKHLVWSKKQNPPMICTVGAI